MYQHHITAQIGYKGLCYWYFSQERSKNWNFVLIKINYFLPGATMKIFFSSISCTFLFQTFMYMAKIHVWALKNHSGYIALCCSYFWHYWNCWKIENTHQKYLNLYEFVLKFGKNTDYVIFTSKYCKLADTIII